ncbi:hypothetical protein RXV86_15845 [Alisedimentitalea sp. MJ-SS2]|uniref:hypothetical protein n=1 Tax=Aliisedimentitalea sp. MJ-SS2 TaxID=3049795 RepID=UPI0029125C33|nr:hypothetical protein [Alisedimentitalea sp. MJ-SS2]MDU8928865.1 hypothetical protein [Alisedimentitalea sp. MJ-SS2]
MLLTTSFVVLSMASAGAAAWDVYDRPRRPDGFEVSVHILDKNPGVAYYRGLPLTADHPSMKYRDGPLMEDLTERFPNALSCLSRDEGDKTVSLARLDTRKFDTPRELETCLQRVGNELGDLSRVVPWLRAVGFAGVSERSARNWLGFNSSGMEADEVAVYRGSWRGRDSIIGRRYPVNRRAAWTVDYGMWIPAKSMDLTIVFRRTDMRVISIHVGMIFL